MTILDLKNPIFDLPDDMEVYILDDAGETNNLLYTSTEESGVIDWEGVLSQSIFVISPLTEDDEPDELLN